MSGQPPIPGPEPAGTPPGGGSPPGYQQPGGYPSYPGYPAQGPGPGWQQPPEPAGPAPGVRWAGNGARLGAYILDAIIVGFVLTLVMVLLVAILFGSTFSSIEWASVRDVEELSPREVLDLFRPLFLIFPILLGVGLLGMAYFVVGWARGGQTLGMRVAGIRVVRDRDGGRIGWGAAIVRLVGYWISGAVFYLGFIWILIDGRRRGWHDLLAGTVVISDG